MAVRHDGAEVQTELPRHQPVIGELTDMPIGQQYMGRRQVEFAGPVLDLLQQAHRHAVFEQKGNLATERRHGATGPITGTAIRWVDQSRRFDDLALNRKADSIHLFPPVICGGGGSAAARRVAMRRHGGGIPHAWRRRPSARDVRRSPLPGIDYSSDGPVRPV